MNFPKDLLGIADLTAPQFLKLLKIAQALKRELRKKGKNRPLLHNKTLAMIFEKPSLRTRVSFEAGMTHMGGHAIYLDAKDAPLGEKESIEDTAKAASRYCDIIMARMFEHENIIKLAKNSAVPVINGLTNLFHPCQILSDLFTIHEKKKKLKGIKLAFVGDGNNNVAHSLLEGCSIVGMDISVGSP